MLRDLVSETVNAPGTAATVNLGGAVTGFRPWISATTFASGDQAYYYATNGALSEWGVCDLAAGPPSTLTRTTVLGNTAGTTARLNLTGTCTFYCEVPAARHPLLDANGKLLQSQMPYQAGFQILRTASVTSSVGAIDLTLDAGYRDFQLILEMTPAAVAPAYARFMQGGAPLAGSTDYYYGMGVVGTGVNFTYGGPRSEIPMTDPTTETVSIKMEFSRPVAGGRILGRSYAYQVRQADGVTSHATDAFRVIPTGEGTAIRVGFIAQNMTNGRAILMGVPAA